LALHGITFQMDEGRVTALLGANGAGKTTTACNLWDDVSQSPTASPINGFAAQVFRDLGVL
jgi:ABC-type multidrug transport system ATPase subunit